MILKDFAEQRNENPHTIATYIRRHPDEFEGHTSMSGNRLVLDDYAVGVLDKIYPLPKPVEIIEDKESRRKLIEKQEELDKAKDLIIELYKQLSETKLQLSDAEHEKLLIETSKSAEIDYLKRDMERDQNVIQELRDKLEEAENRLEEEKSKTWLQKLLGK